MFDFRYKLILEPANGIYLVNTNHHQTSVFHYICIKDGYLFDPLGLSSLRYCKNAVPTNNCQYESANAESCSVWCILFLFFPHQLNNFSCREVSDRNVAQIPKLKILKKNEIKLKYVIKKAIKNHLTYLFVLMAFVLARVSQVRRKISSRTISI